MLTRYYTIKILIKDYIHYFFTLYYNYINSTYIQKL